VRLLLFESPARFAKSEKSGTITPPVACATELAGGTMPPDFALLHRSRRKCGKYPLTIRVHEQAVLRRFKISITLVPHRKLEQGQVSTVVCEETLPCTNRLRRMIFPAFSKRAVKLDFNMLLMRQHGRRERLIIQDHNFLAITCATKRLILSRDTHRIKLLQPNVARFALSRG